MHRRPAPDAAADTATALALAARRGDEVALVSLIELTQADVWRFCAHLASPAEADDLTQETFMRAVRALPRFRGHSTARTWLLSIARRVVADAARAGARRRRLTEALADVSPLGRGSDIGRDPAEAAALADLVAGMRSDHREAFVLTQVLGYAYAEAAGICGCPIGTIRSRVARARADLLRGLEADLAVAPSPRCAPDDRTDADRDQPPAR